MARKFQPQIATGNDLLEGDVVYFTSTGEWSRAISQSVNRVIGTVIARKRIAVQMYGV